MANETSKVKAKLANLDASLGELEALLEPLLAQSLPEIIIGLEPMQQAKLQTVLPYLVYDLVFIYLKAKGVDPKTHSVVSELDRVRQYFEKISNAENPPTRRTEVDKEAAGRFIKQAISQAASTSVPQSASSSISTFASTKLTTKMIARAQYEHTLERERNAPDEEEEELEVYHEPGSDSNSDLKDPVAGDGISNSIPKPTQLASSKRRRPLMDPFTGMRYKPGAPSSRSEPDLGYVDDNSKIGEISSKRPRQDSQNESKTTILNTQRSGDPTPTTVSADRKTKRKKKAKKAEE